MFKLIAAAMLISTAASAQEPGRVSDLTVAEAINVWSGLSSLDSHQTGTVDKNGAPVTAPNNFKFSGTAYMAMARNTSTGLTVYNAYQKALFEVRSQLAAGVEPEKIGPDGVPVDKQDELKRQNLKMLEAPAGVTMIKIREADFCLDVKPPECPVRNAIPISTLSLLMPIIDR